MVAAENLIIRADAGIKIGSGHLMRSLALAQSWQGAVTFVTNCESAALRERLRNEGFAIVGIENSYPHESDLRTMCEVLKKSPNVWCVIDGYHFDAEFHRKIRANGNRVLVIDDTAHLDFYDADAILNQNINADSLHYKCPKDTILLSGTRYALLRNEFLKRRDRKREVPAVARKILITMGGSDFHNQTLKAIRAVERLEIENLKIKAVIGAGNQHFDELKNYVENSHILVELIKNTRNMPELMAWADTAISAAGSTCWEMAFMRLPCLLIVTAENQIGLAAGLQKSGFARNLGWFAQASEIDLAKLLSEILFNSKLRTEMTEKGGEIVDGRGALRVIDFLRKNLSV